MTTHLDDDSVCLEDNYKSKNYSIMLCGLAGLLVSIGIFGFTPGKEDSEISKPHNKEVYCIHPSHSKGPYKYRMVEHSKDFPVTYNHF